MPAVMPYLKNSSAFGNCGILANWIDLKNPCNHRTEYNVAVNQTVAVNKILRKIDGVSNDFTLIYKMSKTDERFFKYFNALNYVLLISTPFLIWLSYFKEYDIYADDGTMDSISMMEQAGNDPFIVKDSEFPYAVLAFYMLCVYLLFFTKRFPLRIYYNGEKYVAIFMSNYSPFRNTAHSFTSATKYKWGPDFGSKSLFLLGYRRARLLPENFRSRDDSFKMTGQYLDE